MSVGKLVHVSNVTLGTRYGRRLYETTAPWEAGPELAARSDVIADFAGIWAAASRETSR